MFRVCRAIDCFVLLLLYSNFQWCTRKPSLLLPYSIKIILQLRKHHHTNNNPDLNLFDLFYRYGWPVQGLWSTEYDGTEIFSVARNASFKDVPAIVSGDNYGRLRLFNYPCKCLFRGYVLLMWGWRLGLGGVTPLLCCRPIPISSGALGSHADLLLSCYVISLAQHITTILITTHP